MISFEATLCQFNFCRLELNALKVQLKDEEAEGLVAILQFIACTTIYLSIFFASSSLSNNRPIIYLIVSNIIANKTE